jgi:putative zinc finger protein
MGSHEEFLELCAAATAGELNADEQTRLDAHLAVCPECRRAKSEYEVASRTVVAAVAPELEPTGDAAGGSWSVEEAEKTFFKRLDREQKQSATPEQNHTEKLIPGGRFGYRPSQICWQEIWMPFAAAVLLALALGIASYRSGLKRGTDVARTIPVAPKESAGSLEEQASDAGYERTQLQAKLVESAKVIDDLKHQLSKQIKVVNSLKSMGAAAANSSGSGQQSIQESSGARAKRDAELTAAQAKLTEFQKTVEAATAQRDENARQAAVLETKVNELTQLVRERERTLDQREAEVAKGQELLAHDRDIRELPTSSTKSESSLARLARIPARARDQSVQTRRFRQSDSANSAPRERHYDDEHLREDGECGRSECDEVVGNDVCNYCATREARKYANHVEVFLVESL